MRPCEFCGGEIPEDDDVWCCEALEGEFAKFMARVDAKRDEMFWAIVDPARPPASGD